MPERKTVLSYEEIYRLWMTREYLLREIADKAGVTMQRIHQIVREERRRARRQEGRDGISE